MINYKKNIVLGVICFMISFILLYIGVRYVANNQIDGSNILAYVMFSLIIGLITTLKGVFNLKISLATFLIFVFFGFFQMYRAFIGGLTGWGDLIGIISLIMWSIIGFVAGLFFQLTYYLYNKYNKQN